MIASKVVHVHNQIQQNNTSIVPHFNDRSNSALYKLRRPNQWADSINSLSLISALVFGFAAAVLTNVQQPDNDERHFFFAMFANFLCGSIGLAFVGLAVTSIMYHNIKGFIAYKLQKGLLIYERKSYLIKNMAYYFIYISWALLIAGIVMYCWVFFDFWIAQICTIVMGSFLVTGVSFGVYLANMYAKYNGDENIFNVMNPERVGEVMAHTQTLEMQPTQSDEIHLTD